MHMRSARLVRRLVVALLLVGGLGGCVLAPPYAYDAAYPAYDGYPAYAAPPIAVDLGFGFYDRPRHYGYDGHGHPGWRRHGAWSGHRGGPPRHGGGWRHGRGRH